MLSIAHCRFHQRRFSGRYANFRYPIAAAETSRLTTQITIDRVSLQPLTRHLWRDQHNFSFIGSPFMPSLRLLHPSARQVAIALLGEGILCAYRRQGQSAYVSSMETPRSLAAFNLAQGFSLCARLGNGCGFARPGRAA